jgi:hypothetical protein
VSKGFLLGENRHRERDATHVVHVHVFASAVSIKPQLASTAEVCLVV